MEGMINATVIGRLAADPEMRTVGSSTVCDMRLAINRKKKGVKTVMWLSATIWGKPAEIIIDYVRKGQDILLVGELVEETWEDKQSGEERKKLKLDAKQFKLMGRDKKDEEPEPVKDHPLANNDGFGEEEIPF